MDYRDVYCEVYEPQGYTVCPTSTSNIQCWLPLAKSVDCKLLFDDYLHVLNHHTPVFPAPRELKAGEEGDFLLGGYTILSSLYFAQLSHAPNAPAPVWTADSIRNFTVQAQARQPMGAYGHGALNVYQALDCHPVKGLRGAVFGSETPWLEAILFVYGKISGHIVRVGFCETYWRLTLIPSLIMMAAHPADRKCVFVRV